MRFEEALKAMREGKKVKRPAQFVPKTMKNGRIVEVYKNKDGKRLGSRIVQAGYSAKELGLRRDKR